MYFGTVIFPFLSHWLGQHRDMTVIVICLKQDRDMISNILVKFQTCHGAVSVSVTGTEKLL